MMWLGEEIWKSGLLPWYFLILSDQYCSSERDSNLGPKHLYLLEFETWQLLKHGNLDHAATIAGFLRHSIDTVNFGTYWDGIYRKPLLKFANWCYSRTKASYKSLSRRNAFSFPAKFISCIEDFSNNFEIKLFSFLACFKNAKLNVMCLLRKLPKTKQLNLGFAL